MRISSLSYEWPLRAWLPYMFLGILPLTGTRNVVLFYAILFLRNWRAAFSIVNSQGLWSIGGITGGATFAIGSVQVLKGPWKSAESKDGSFDEAPRPLLFPSRTTHTRVFPKSHSFSYSYLLVGVPVGWQGSAGGMIASDGGGSCVGDGSQHKSSRAGWYTVDAGDYLNRGDRHLGFDGKLRKFLKEQVCTYCRPHW